MASAFRYPQPCARFCFYLNDPVFFQQGNKLAVHGVVWRAGDLCQVVRVIGSLRCGNNFIALFIFFGRGAFWLIDLYRGGIQSLNGVTFWLSISASVIACAPLFREPLWWSIQASGRMRTGRARGVFVRSSDTSEESIPDCGGAGQVVFCSCFIS